MKIEQSKTTLTATLDDGTVVLAFDMPPKSDDRLRELMMQHNVDFQGFAHAFDLLQYINDEMQGGKRSYGQVKGDV